MVYVSTLSAAFLLSDNKVRPAGSGLGLTKAAKEFDSGTKRGNSGSSCCYGSMRGNGWNSAPLSTTLILLLLLLFFLCLA